MSNGSSDTTAAQSEQPLFRDEVLLSRKTSWLGGINVARPIGFTWWAFGAAVLAGSLISFAIWGEVTKKATLHGILMPREGLVVVRAPQDGLLGTLPIQEGETVKTGQLLVRVRSVRTTVTGDATARNAAALSERARTFQTEKLLVQQQLQQRVIGLQDRLRNLQVEQRQAESELESSALRVKLAIKSVERYSELAKGGFISGVQEQQKQEELLDLQIRHKNAERSFQALHRDILSLEAERESIQTSTKSSLAQIDRNISALTQEVTENDARAELVVHAPFDGRISSLPLRSGQMVQSGQTLLSLTPQINSTTEFIAQLYAPSRTAGFVQVGQRVWLRYEAYPYQKFGMSLGEVTSVGQAPVAPVDLPIGQSQALLSAANANEPLYQIDVRVRDQSVMAYGRPYPLKAGMTLQADVVQDRRAVWEWFLEPVLAAWGNKSIFDRGPTGDPTNAR